MNILIDSSGWIEYFANSKNADKFYAYIKDVAKKTTFTPSIVIYEVYKRLNSQLGEEVAIQAVAYIQNYTCEIPLDADLAVIAAEISSQEKLAMADSIIAATARVHDAQIITGDSDLRNIPNAVFISKT